MTKVVLVATHNRGKIAEYRDMMQDLALDWLGLADVGVTLEVAETGKTFKENAVLKAAGYSAETGLLTLADDSGLEVDALKGEPGVLTARYGGAGLTPKERYEHLLRNLADVPWEARTARFRCVIALYNKGRLVGTAEGSCEGMIAMEPAGEGGFGYDPVFYLPDRQVTMAQLPPEEKHKISHRGRAVAGIAPLLRGLIG
ncbi:MAG: RdgB/HAM1 family non-canonical purine NTP pyrophosphatase [Candidatus Promineifilaceae bacterium]